MGMGSRVANKCGERIHVLCASAGMSMLQIHALNIQVFIDTNGTEAGNTG